MKTIIVYSSMTGTTEYMAEAIANELISLGEEVKVKDAMVTDATDLNFYDRILIGSYTWGEGDLPDEMLDFYEELKDIDLTGKMGAVFGAGDSSYRYFARAVDIFEEVLSNKGCQILTKGLKVDRESEEELRTICKWFSKKLTEADEKMEII